MFPSDSFAIAARAVPGRADAVRARDLTKTYTFHEQQPGLGGAVRSLLRRARQTRTAVDGVDFELSAGEIVGLLGRNGAGKTTTLKMLCGLLRPTAGELSVLGFRPADRRFDFLRRVAVVLGQKSMLWWDVPAMDSFLVHKAMYAMPSADFDASVRELSDMLGVDRLLQVPVRKLSLGERMRCELMLALLHRPDLLFLDEPTIGLDVVAKAAVRDFLAKVNATRGTTILLTSHDMDDVEALCPRVLLIDSGRLRYDGSLARLVRSVRPRKRVQVMFANPVELPAALPADVELVSTREQLEFTFDVDRTALPSLLGLAATWGQVSDLDVGDPDVDEIMRTVFADGTVVRP